MSSDYDNLISSVSNDLFPYHTHSIIGRFRIFNSETGNLLLFSGDDGSLALMEMVHNENWSIPWDGISLDVSASALNLGEEPYDGMAIFDSTINLEEIYLGSFRSLLFKSDENLLHFDGFLTDQKFDKFSVVAFENQNVLLNGVLLFPPNH